MPNEDLNLGVLDAILARNLAWVAAADAKVAPVLAIDTAMLGVLAALLPGAEAWRTVPAIASALAALLLFFSVVSLAFATFPRLSGPKASLIFFAGIASLDRHQYVSKVLAATPSELKKDLAEQCHRNAEIAQAKFAWIRGAMIFLLCSIPAWVTAVALLYTAGPGGAR